MTKNQEVIFKDFCYSYANRFLLCMSSYTTVKYIKIFSKSHWWVVPEYMKDKHNIPIDDTDRKHYNIYEKIMIEVLSTRIEQCKLEQIEKEKKVKDKKK